MNMYESKMSKSLKSWAERKYYTESYAVSCSKSIAFNKEFVTQNGAKLYTDGVKEANKKDDFNSLTVSGYNYALLCLYGSQFKSMPGARILIYINEDSDWDIGKFKAAIKEDMKAYTGQN